MKNEELLKIVNEVQKQYEMVRDIADKSIQAMRKCNNTLEYLLELIENGEIDE